MKKITKKVFVGMSGGVDSSVSAYLLKKQGYEVVGIFIRSFNVDGCEEKDSEDARRVAEHLKIPFYVWDFEEEYKKKVVDYMVLSYKKGITPNPDVMCNKEIKFGMFFNRAIELGADYVATGHYAQIKKVNGKFKMFAGLDDNKDQTYFLWTLNQKHLPKVLFPIGDLEKSEVRKIANKIKLSNANKKDSQGICFLGKVSIKDFLKKYLPIKKGNVLSENGKKVGEHEGVWFYTLGQRHGLNISGKNPIYISGKNLKKNEIIVSEGESPDLFAKKIIASELNWISEKPKMPIQVLARVRYRQPLSLGLLSKKNKNKIMVEFKEPRKFVAHGQSIVIYNRDGEVLGGGIIESFS